MPIAAIFTTSKQTRTRAARIRTPGSRSGHATRPPPSATSSPRRARRSPGCRPAASSRSSPASSRRTARPGASRFEVVEAKDVVVSMVEDFSLLSESDSEDELVESKKATFVQYLCSFNDRFFLIFVHYKSLFFQT